jgi:hypothetical protein
MFTKPGFPCPKSTTPARTQNQYAITQTPMIAITKKTVLYPAPIQRLSCSTQLPRPSCTRSSNVLSLRQYLSDHSGSGQLSIFSPPLLLLGGVGNSLGDTGGLLVSARLGFRSGTLMPTRSTSSPTPSPGFLSPPITVCARDSGDLSVLGKGNEDPGESEREPVRILLTLPPRSISTLDADSMMPHSGSFLGSGWERERRRKSLPRSNLRSWYVGLSRSRRRLRRRRQR